LREKEKEMSTVTIPKAVTSQEVIEALRNSLDSRYEVLSGMRMPRAPFAIPRSGAPELIMVTAGPMVRAQVKIVPRAEGTDLQITPGGLLGDLLMNTLGVARKVRQALLHASTLNVGEPTH
jgi:hypothetical protein